MRASAGMPRSAAARAGALCGSACNIQNNKAVQNLTQGIHVITFTHEVQRSWEAELYRHGSVGMAWQGKCSSKVCRQVFYVYAVASKGVVGMK